MSRHTERNQYTALELGIASPETVRKWSHGEITKPETINYKTLKPEKDGLFDERIFGPVKDYECACGKYKKVKHKNKICEKCGVDVTEAIVRRERMGHIQLVAPVAHIWMLKAAPSKVALLLSMKVKEVEQIVYFVSHVVVNVGDEVTSKLVKVGEVLDLSDQKKAKETRGALRKILRYIKEEKVQEGTFAAKRAQVYYDRLADSNIPFSIKEVSSFIEKHTGMKLGIGAEAIRDLLKNLDLQAMYDTIRTKLETGKDDSKKLTQRLDVVEAFLTSENKPEWMVMDAIPVTPPDSRPIIQLDGGRFTTSDLNNLYRRIIIRNERLKKVMEMQAPSIIVNNEKRMLQEAVDALIDNSRRSKPLMGKDKRPFKSLTDYLKGKQGRFRQNLLGKRADYSGRSVIAVGPNLKMYQCGLPGEMALQLFKPFIIHKLIKAKLVTNIKLAERLIVKQDNRVWPIVEEVLSERPVLLNRAPTLHRLGIQAFEPVLIDGKAIRLHPLVTPAFNADFDGDQMAVHVPLSKEAVAEARSILLASWHILGPKDGKPIVTPTQDMVLGNYYLTMENHDMKGQGMIFSSTDEVELALQAGRVHLHTLIAIKTDALESKKVTQGGYLITTPGKITFNLALPNDFMYINEPNAVLGEMDRAKFVEFGENIHERIESIKVSLPFKKKYLSTIIDTLYKQHAIEVVAQTMDNLKDLGFKYSSISGTTVSAFDVPMYEKKKEYFVEADEYISKIKKLYAKGLITNQERYQAVIRKWSAVKDQVTIDMESIATENFNNPIFMMSDSGARGNISNFTQLAGMRGLMSNPKGETIELPIKSSFRDGLSVSEFFISTHGARKGMADTALKTADSGYLTRRLVDVAQDCIISTDDCKTEKGLVVGAIVDTKTGSVIEPLKDRLAGRYSLENVIDPSTGELIVNRETLITPELAIQIEKSGIERIEIRSVFECKAKTGICQKCFGSDLSTHETVEVGTTVGIISAQSIGEPGTQLTMRTFHTGGVAGEADITQGLPRIKELLDVTKPKGRVALISEIKGSVLHIEEDEGKYHITVKNNVEEKTYTTDFSPILRVKVEDDVNVGTKLTDGSIDLKNLLEVTDITEVQEYIVKEVQRVYRLQGIEIADKYIEVIVNQMLNRVIVVAPGTTKLTIGSLVHKNTFNDANREVLKSGGTPAIAKNVILGIKKAPLESDSFLSAASFQDTTRVLAKAAIRGKIDPLKGLKENVILGKLIPAGTGLKTSEEIIAFGDFMKAKQY